MVWQLIRIHLLSSIAFSGSDLIIHEDLTHIKQRMSTRFSFALLSPEQMLLKLVNYHIELAGYKGVVKNFGGDLKVCRFQVD
jgi:hypothetical protein